MTYLLTFLFNSPLVTDIADPLNLQYLYVGFYEHTNINKCWPNSSINDQTIITY